MGHIQYYIQYKDLPLQFRSGANNGKFFSNNSPIHDLHFIFDVLWLNLIKIYSLLILVIKNSTTEVMLMQ